MGVHRVNFFMQLQEEQAVKSTNRNPSSLCAFKIPSDLVLSAG